MVTNIRSTFTSPSTTALLGSGEAARLGRHSTPMPVPNGDDMRSSLRSFAAATVTPPKPVVASQVEQRKGAGSSRLIASAEGDQAFFDAIKSDLKAEPGLKPATDSSLASLRKVDNRTGFDLSKVADNTRRAREAGADPARSAFVKKLGGALIGALAIAVGLTLTVVTGGTILIAATAIGGVLLAKASADAGCAYMALKNARAEAQGQPKPFHLPMGGDSVGNLVHLCLPKSLSDDDRKRVAAYTSQGVTVALNIAIGVLAGGAAVPAIAANMLLTTALFVWQRQDASKAESGLQHADGQAMLAFAETGMTLEGLHDKAAQLSDADRSRVEEQILQHQDRMLAAVEKLALSVEAKTLVPAGKLARDLTLDAIQKVGDRAALPFSDAVKNFKLVDAAFNTLRIVDAANTFRQAVAETASIKTQQTEYGQATAALKNEVEVLSLRDQVDGSRLTQIRI
jgi:hypothetical protein